VSGHSARDEAERVFLHLRRVFGGEARRATEPFSGGDVFRIGSALTAVEHRMGWDEQLGRARLIVGWAEIVGPEVARHTEAYLSGETVIVKCDSTAWAASLRRMEARVMGRIHEALPEISIAGLRFVGPDAPSWGHGPRSVPGRGPRDTYG
jgi:predicted nucleic acid-binding Zn ribbon protein